MIKGKIDVSKIDKAKLYKNDKGVTYLDIALIETPNSKWGQDYMIVQDLPKAERDAGNKGAILGNAKIFTQRDPRIIPPKDDNDKGGDVPF